MFATAENVGIVIVGTFKVHPDDRQAFKEIVVPHIAETSALEGALFYTFAQDVRDDSVFHILEGWTARDNLHAHNASAEFQETLKKVGEKVRILGRDVNIYTVGAQEFIPLPSQH
jgi:quinol monooxygenase YgiN